LCVTRAAQGINKTRPNPTLTLKWFCFAAAQRRTLEAMALERDAMQQRVFDMGAVEAEKEELKRVLSKVQGEHAELTLALDQAQVRSRSLLCPTQFETAC
jgi:hypothetical protein